MSKQYVLIGRGKNGWHADGMYDKDSTFSSTGGLWMGISPKRGKVVRFMIAKSRITMLLPS